MTDPKNNSFNIWLLPEPHVYLNVMTYKPVLLNSYRSSRQNGRAAESWWKVQADHQEPSGKKQQGKMLRVAHVIVLKIFI